MASLGAVIVHLPERLSRHGGMILKAIGERGALLVLAGTTGDARADAEVELSVRRIADDGPAATLPDTGVMAVVDVDRTRIVTASDCDEEVRAAVRAVVDAARAGTPLDRMAILHASPEPYARLAHEQLTAAGIRSERGGGHAPHGPGGGTHAAPALRAPGEGLPPRGRLRLVGRGPAPS